MTPPAGLFRRAFDASPHGVALVTLDGVLLYCNPPLAALLGRDPDSLVGRTIADGVPPEDYAAAAAHVQTLLARPDQAVAFELSTRGADGTAVRLHLELAVVSGDDATESCLLAQVTDVTPQWQEEQRRQQYDELTGLSNRVHLEDVAARSLAVRPSGEIALAVLDIDEFRLINDSLGHAAGDELLVQLGARLRDLDPRVLVARLGDDDFALLLQRGGQDRAVELAEGALAAAALPFALAEQAVTLRANVGIAVADRPVTAADLLRNADLAMYAAKADGTGGIAVYEPAMLTESRFRLQMGELLRHAVRRAETRVHYQPVVDIRTGRVTGAEALLRWHSRELGPVPPERFIPVAERTGAIAELGTWVLRQGCRWAARRLEDGLPALQVSVNLSVAQLRDPAVVATVERALQEVDLPPRLLTLEITESLLVRDGDPAVHHLEQIARLGVMVSVDDFGTGHSTFARLRTLQVSTLKIDRSLIAEIDTVGEQATIVGAIVAMARALGLHVVAEGVETASQLRALEQLGCSHVQGFLLYPPLDEESLAERLATQDGQPAQRRERTGRPPALARGPRLSAGDADGAGVVATVMNQMCRALQADAAFVVRADGAGSSAVVEHVSGPRPDLVEALESGCGWQRLCDAALAAAPPVQLGHDRHVVAVPLSVRDTSVRGAVCVIVPDSVGIGAGTRRLIGTLAQLIGERAEPPRPAPRLMAQHQP